jgi:hypothetical protein
MVAAGPSDARRSATRRPAKRVLSDEALQRTLIWGGFSLLLTLLGLWRPDGGRAAIAVCFLLMAVMVNSYATFTETQSSVAWANTALPPLTRRGGAGAAAPTGHGRCRAGRRRPGLGVHWR